ncbi:hypothetical protein KQH65_02800 [archaeon]|nr:hypothetical protein [archaeon]
MSDPASNPTDDEINAFKNALGDLRADLSSLKDESTQIDTPEQAEAQDSGEVMDLKRRMARSEEEMKALTDAMKSTLLDVRSMMQDMDNPFDMLRNLGVDKLVNKAVEDVENEVVKQKQEERKKKMAKGEELPEKIIAMQAAPAVQPQPIAQPAINIPAPANSYNPNQTNPVFLNDKNVHDSSIGGARQGLPSTHVNNYTRPQEGNIPDEVSSRFDKTEKTINKLTDQFSDLSENVEKIFDMLSNKNQKKDKAFEPQPTLRENAQVQSLYYDTYVSLLAEYLTIKFGEKNARQLLLEGLYKGWASPRVIKDVRDNLPSDSKGWDIAEAAMGYSVADSKTDVEDRILFTSLLGSLDKPVNEWKEITQVFLLLSLVNCAKKNRSLLEE